MKENETENMLNVLINDNIQRNDLLLSFTNFILATTNGVIAIDVNGVVAKHSLLDSYIS